MPIPVSITSRLTVFSFFVIMPVTDPFSVNLIALSRRLFVMVAIDGKGEFTRHNDPEGHLSIRFRSIPFPSAIIFLERKD